MTPTKCAGVIKRDSIEVEGSFSLKPAAMMHGQAQSVSCISAPTTHAACQAQIIENNAEYAVIEITCVCGNKNVVECRY